MSVVHAGVENDPWTTTDYVWTAGNSLSSIVNQAKEGLKIVNGPDMFT